VTNTHAICGARTRDPSNQAAADLRVDNTTTSIASMIQLLNGIVNGDITS